MTVHPTPHVYLVTVFYEHGDMPAGVFSTLDQAKAATEIACDATVPASYGECLSGSIVELELDRLYSGEDVAGHHDYVPDGFANVPTWLLGLN